MNAIAGGGTLLTFPAAMAVAGLSARVASATSTVALAPGAFAAAWSYRKQLTNGRKLTLVVVVPAGIGGLMGATLLKRFGDDHFEAIVPWMVLLATAAIAARELIARRLARRRSSVTSRPAAGGAAQTEGTPGQGRLGWLALVVWALAVYGGYFGAGMSIVLLSVLSLWGLELLQANAIKTLALGWLNLVAAMYFLVSGLADVHAASVMALGAIAGGAGGAHLAQRVSPGSVRALVVIIGVTVSVVLAYRQLNA